MTPWLSAQEAAERLRIKPATLYAYASRGYLRRRPAPDGRRSEYHGDDVAALAVRGRRARPVRPSDVVVATGITAITPRGPAYRGRLAVALAGTASFEDVAARLWGTAALAPWPSPAPLQTAARVASAGLPADVEPLSRLPLLVAAAAVADPLRHHLAAAAVVRAARDLIGTVVAALSPEASPEAACTPSIAAGLAAALGVPADRATAALVDAALVLLADHEMAASTLAARTAASARCDPYAVVLAGLSVMSGLRHGAASRPLELVLREVAAGTDAATALAAHVGPSEPLPGFGHPLYPDGDPRALRLIDLLDDAVAPERAAPLHTLCRTAAERGLPPPNVDTALAGVCHALGAPVGSAGLLFAVARMAGWLGHALEQYADPELLRPRAVYTGPVPTD